MSAVLPRSPQGGPARGAQYEPASGVPAGKTVGTLTVTALTGIEEFSALAPEWRKLLEESNANCLFLTWEWLYTWWTHLAGSRRLRVLTVRRGSELVGIAPFALRAVQPARLVPYRALEFLGSGTAGSDYLDLIFRRGVEVDATSAVAEYLSCCNIALDLRRVAREGANVQRLAAELERRGWETHYSADDVCLYIPLSGSSWEQYFAGLSREFRRSLRRGRRDADAGYNVAYLPVRREEERESALRAFIELHNKRWDERRGSEAIPDEKLVAFHEAWSRYALSRGWLRLALVQFDDRPVAGTYGFAYGGKLYFYLSAFDPGFSRYGAGRICLEENLREAFSEGLTEYDFLHGAEPYKYHWARDSRSLGWYRVFPPGARGAMARTAFRARETLKALAHGAVSSCSPGDGG